MIIDAHCHIFPPSFLRRKEEIVERDAAFASLVTKSHTNFVTVDDLLSQMDKNGVDRAVVMGIGWSDIEIATEANDYIIESVNDNKDRLRGFCSVNPNWGEFAFDEVKRCIKAGLSGIGELQADFQNFDLREVADLAPIMELARSDALPVMVHASEPIGHGDPHKDSTTPEKLYRFIQNFPGNPIICAHWGGGLPFYSLMPEVKESLKLVYFDCAVSPSLYTPEIFSVATESVGAGKIFFGSDFPFVDMTRALEHVGAVKLVPDVKANLLSNNIMKVLRW